MILKIAIAIAIALVVVICIPSVIATWMLLMKNLGTFGDRQRHRRALSHRR